jgi:hypothetical protein
LKIDEVREYALSLPEANEEPHFKYNSFRVRGRIFATVPPGEQFMHVFVDEQRRELAIAMFPDAYEKLWWGKKVTGIKVTLANADASDVKDLLYSAWKQKAPKRLIKETEIENNNSF